MLSTEEEEQKPVVSSFDLDGVIEYMKSEECTSISFLTGAGMSVSCGIPDFRTPKIGLYSTLQRYNLPDPQMIFDISYLQENPTPFYDIMKTLTPGSYKPSPAHHFMKLIQDKKLLNSVFTQNIDGLERLSGINPDILYECHGHFYTFHCIKCHEEYKLEEFTNDIKQGNIIHCHKPDCEGLVKPDVVFFGEALPVRVFEDVEEKLQTSDLIFIMGTSLCVHPFASFVNFARPDALRVLINRDPVGEQYLQYQKDKSNTQDVFLKGDCDVIIKQICDRMGWTVELNKLINS